MTSPEKDAGEPTLCGIVLHPAGHTLSPLLHETAYEALGLRASYEAFDVPTTQLDATLRQLWERGMKQLSVSLPHKEVVLKHADRVSDAAREIGAANTLTRVGDALCAENTDWIGVIRSLEQLGPWQGRRATVLGAGGAARAVVYALLRLEMEVTILNRSPARAERLSREIGGSVGQPPLRADLVVNATPVGMSPEIDATPVSADQLPPEATVFDTVYRPLETRLLREARERGCRTQDGLDMLVFQAVEQIRLWSGRVADARLLRAAAERELRG